MAASPTSASFTLSMLSYTNIAFERLYVAMGGLSVVPISHNLEDCLYSPIYITFSEFTRFRKPVTQITASGEPEQQHNVADV
jgi:hypothetical protein